MTGTLYGLGIGPGDPDLITIKARDILAAVPVIAYPAPEGGESLVRAIAAPHIPAGRTEIVISTPMTSERFPAQEVYDHFSRVIADHLEAGTDVAVLCEGDPFLYGSFMYMFERIANIHRSEVVPGVSSLGAVAAAAGVPLASRNQVMTILPATLPEEELAARLAATETAAIMKVGRHFAKVRRVLERLGLDKNACYVERATMKQQKVARLDTVEIKDAPYFSMILARHPQTTTDRSRTALHDFPQGSALVTLGPGGVDLARRLRAVLPGSQIHGLVGRTGDVDLSFSETPAYLRKLFAEGVPIVGICAAGILIRALAPLLADKGAEPPVVCVAEDGSSVVPLLGGHHGANDLARTIAASTGGTAAITTASDVRYGFAIDDPPPGWRVVNPDAAKDVAAALLAGDPVALHIEAGDAGWLTESNAPFSEHGSHAIWVTDRADVDLSAALVLRPPVLAVGVGCERGVSSEEVIGLVEQTLEAHVLSTDAVACVTSIDIKADEAAVHAVAEKLGVAVRFFTAEELNAEAPRLMNPSERVYREVGCPGVAEGSALAAAGPEAALIVEKTRSQRATCAIARAPAGISPRVVGRPRGHLTVIGIGPGTEEWRTPEVTRVLADVTDVVGYELYLNLIKDDLVGKVRHTSNLSEEEARVRKALELAADGRSVALVSSGDAGMYGLAALVFEPARQREQPPVEPRGNFDRAWNFGVSGCREPRWRTDRARSLHHIALGLTDAVAGDRKAPKGSGGRRFRRRSLQSSFQAAAHATEYSPGHPAHPAATGDAGCAGPQSWPRWRTH